MEKGKKHSNALYNQIKSEILNHIISNNLPPHAMLPSEGEFASRFHVSKMTVKLALNKLAEDGIIYRIPRSGSFVASAAVDLLANSKPRVVEKTQTVALVVPQVDFYIADIIENVEQQVSARDNNVVIKITKNELAERQSITELCRNPDVSGIIVFPLCGKLDPEVTARLRAANYPIVMIDCVCKDRIIDCVCHNHYRGAYDATKYLIDMGHRNIGFVTYKHRANETRRERCRGYLDALTDNGIAVSQNRIMRAEDSKSLPELQRYFESNRDLTAVFCVNDVVATSLVIQATKLGMEVPGDVSVVGFSDNRLLDYAPISLTTVRQPVQQLAAKAVEVLYNKIQNNDAPVEIIRIATEIVCRESVKKLC